MDGHVGIHVLAARADRGYQAAKAQRGGVLAHRCEHDIRQSLAPHVGPDGDLQRRHQVSAPAGELIHRGVEDHSIPAIVRQRLGRIFFPREWDAAGLRDESTWIVTVHRDHDEVRVSHDRVGVVHRAHRILEHELGPLVEPVQQRREIGPLRHRRDQDVHGLHHRLRHARVHASSDSYRVDHGHQQR